MTELTPGEMAQRSGVAVSALHFYEREGLIVSRRTSGNQRRYARETLRRVAFIRMSQRLGHTAGAHPRGAGLAAHQSGSDQQGLGAALGGLARRPRRADRAPAAAARQPAGCIGCGCLTPEDVRAVQPGRRARRPRDPARPTSEFERMCDNCRGVSLAVQGSLFDHAERRDLGDGAWIDVRAGALTGWADPVAGESEATPEMDSASTRPSTNSSRPSRGGPNAGRCTTACSTSHGWSASTTSGRSRRRTPSSRGCGSRLNDIYARELGEPFTIGGPLPVPRRHRQRRLARRHHRPQQHRGHHGGHRQPRRDAGVRDAPARRGPLAAAAAGPRRPAGDGRIVPAHLGARGAEDRQGPPARGSASSSVRATCAEVSRGPSATAATNRSRARCVLTGPPAGWARTNGLAVTITRKLTRSSRRSCRARRWRACR